MVGKILSLPMKLLASRVRRGVSETLSNYGFMDVEVTRPNDVFIVGYPKSGNTWVQFMMASIVSGIPPERLNLSLVLEFVPDIHYQKIYKRFYEVCYFKSHDLPSERFRRVVYLIRDGRDALISYYHMKRALGEPVSLESMVQNGEGLFPCKWHEHVAQWYNNPYRSEMIVIRYEDLRQNTIGEMRRLCDFCGLTVTQEQLSTVVSGCTFERLKLFESLHGLVDGRFRFPTTTSSSFFRGGRSGDYLNELDDQLLRYFNKEAKDQLLQFGYRIS